MNNFIDGTLKSMQRIASGKSNPQDYVECDIAQTIDFCLQKYPFSYEDKKLVHFNCVSNFDFRGCPLAFYRILFNLLNNSLQQIQKNKDGEIFISIGHQDGMNYLKFKDTAGGIAAERLPFIFDGYKTTRTNGTGIGLAFCKLAMNSFGGDILCESVEGDYIEFTLLFPPVVEIPQQAPQQLSCVKETMDV